MFKVVIALAAGASAFVAKAPLPSAARAAKTTMTMVDESVLGVQAPAGFLDPLGFVAKDGPEAFVRRRAVAQARPHRHGGDHGRARAQRADRVPRLPLQVG